MSYSLRLISSRSKKTLEDRLRKAGVDSEGVRILMHKAETVIIKVDDVPAAGANIIKQQLLSLGADAAVHREVIKGKPERSTVYLIGDRRRLSELAAKLEYQQFNLPRLAAGISKLLAARDHPPASILLPAGEFDLTDPPLVMGILNVTPDSFSDGGLYVDPGRAAERAVEMVAQGASIIDIGGESSRPGAADLSVQGELERVIPVLEKLAATLAVPISIDTRKAVVARAAMDAGASIINDISGLRHDPEILEAAIDTGAAVVIMHMQGTPETMQLRPSYEDAVSEIIAWLDTRTKEIVSSGLPPEKIIIDPGIGFGKRLTDNLEIIDEIGDFHSLGFPVCIGYSRKSFIGAVTGRNAGERLSGGLAALGQCLGSGVQIVRVHDVRETVDYIKVWKAVQRKEVSR